LVFFAVGFWFGVSTISVAVIWLRILRCCWWVWRWRSHRLVLTSVVVLVWIQIGVAFVGPGLGF
jgi:hypothetical protein